MKKLTSAGYSHIIIPLLILVSVAIYGTYLLVASHALAPTSCIHQTGPFNVSGNHIVDGQGNRFTPYGITIFGLAQPGWQSSISTDDAQINAIATSWCANTVRIQVAPTNLLSNIPAGQTYNPAFMSALDGEVQLAFKDNLIVVITAQTALTNNTPNPTAQTLAYWKVLGAHYKGTGNIIFDLFNEPRAIAANDTKTWQLWHNGGNGTPYIGMQTLVTDLRQAGIAREFWVEGPYSSDTLSEVPTYPIVGSNIVYALHHPLGAHTIASWNTDFGNLAATSPVVDGEWAQYASSGAICWADAPTAVPQYLAYLRSKQIGLILWTLKTGVLVSGSNLSVPTQMTTKVSPTYQCNGNVDEGAGQLFMNYFHTNNVT